MNKTYQLTQTRMTRLPNCSWVFALLPILLSYQAFAGPTAPQVKVPVTFKVQNAVEMTGGRVGLKDLATCRGNQIVCDESYGVDLGESPEPGKLRYIKKSELTEMLGREWPNADIRIEGPDTIKVSAKTITIDQSMVETALRDALVGKFSGNAQFRAEVKKVQLSVHPRVRPCDHSIRFPIFEMVTAKGSKEFLIKNIGGHQNFDVVYACNGEGFESRFKISANIQVSLFLPVATQNLPRGTLMRSTDFAQDWVRIGRTKKSYVSDPKKLIGMRLSRTVRVGDPVQHSNIARPDVIKRGQIVKLLMERKGMNVSGQVKAMEAGGYGELITVESVSTRKRMKVRIKNKTTVEYVF